MSLAFASAAAPPSDFKSRIDKFLRVSAESMGIPGFAYAVVKDGKVICQGAHGLSNLTYKVRATPKTPFLLASITKQFTAAAIMRLAEQGKVKIDEPISTYLADAPESWHAITVRNLLNHTGGLKDRFEEKNTSLWRLNYSELAMYEAAKSTPVDFAPGTAWQYTDQGYFLLGRIIEEVSGQKYRAFLEESFFKPLGMTSTTTIAMKEIVPNLAEGYAMEGGKIIHNHRRTDYGLVSHFGVISTVGDLAKWVIAMNSGKALKPETVKEMWTPARLADGSEVTGTSGSYGLGWFLEWLNGHRVVQHGGATGTALYTLPDDHLAVIVLTNLEQLSGGNATSLAQSVAKFMVPDASWGSLRPLEDQGQHAEFTTELRHVLSAENANESLYDPTFYRLYRTALASQKAQLAQLGKPLSVDLLFVRPTGSVHTLGYRVKYKDLTLYATVRVGADGKIRYLGAENEELP
ncbi:serine hydrolase domain-containing protein [Fimbriimonas ginsengisoli]|nr:serine hydrolase domain-containing protein [Fimbriimonas ginsengisoli]